MPKQENELLNLTEVADRLRVTPRTIQRWVLAKRIPQPIRLNGTTGRPLWRSRDIDLLIEGGSIHAYRRAKRRD